MSLTALDHAKSILHSSVIQATFRSLQSNWTLRRLNKTLLWNTYCFSNSLLLIDCGSLDVDSTLSACSYRDVSLTASSEAEGIKIPGFHPKPTSRPIKWGLEQTSLLSAQQEQPVSHRNTFNGPGQPLSLQTFLPLTVSVYFTCNNTFPGQHPLPFHIVLDLNVIKTHMWNEIFDIPKKGVGIITCVQTQATVTL